MGFGQKNQDGSNDKANEAPPTDVMDIKRRWSFDFNCHINFSNHFYLYTIPGTRIEESLYYQSGVCIWTGSRIVMLTKIRWIVFLLESLPLFPNTSISID